MNPPDNQESSLKNVLGSSLTRRSFFGLAGIAALGLAAGSLASCSNASGNSSTGSSKKAISVAFVSAGYPTSFLDDSGNPAGYEIDVLKHVEELLPEHSF